jgi:hypothetical protein
LPGSGSLYPRRTICCTLCHRLRFDCPLRHRAEFGHAVRHQVNLDRYLGTVDCPLDYGTRHHTTLPRTGRSLDRWPGYVALLFPSGTLHARRQLRCSNGTRGTIYITLHRQTRPRGALHRQARLCVALHSKAHACIALPARHSVLH